MVEGRGIAVPITGLSIGSPMVFHDISAMFVLACCCIRGHAVKNMRTKDGLQLQYESLTVQGVPLYYSNCLDPPSDAPFN